MKFRKKKDHCVMHSLQNREEARKLKFIFKTDQLV